MIIYIVIYLDIIVWDSQGSVGIINSLLREKRCYITNGQESLWVDELLVPEDSQPEEVEANQEDPKPQLVNLASKLHMLKRFKTFCSRPN